MQAHQPLDFPYLDHDAGALQEDNVLKLEVAELKSKYSTCSLL